MQQLLQVSALHELGNDSHSTPLNHRTEEQYDVWMTQRAHHANLLRKGIDGVVVHFVGEHGFVGDIGIVPLRAMHDTKRPDTEFSTYR